MSDEFQGMGEAFSETGSEGIHWCLLKDTKENESWQYENLILFDKGDHLTIFDKSDPSKIVWEGDIHLEYESHLETNIFGWTAQAIHNHWCHGLQVGTDQEAWAKYFMNHHPMTLRKK